MCTYVTTTTEVAGSAYLGDDWFPVDRAVVYFDHPQDAPFEHALCIDLWGGRTRVAVPTQEIEPLRNDSVRATTASIRKRR